MQISLCFVCEFFSKNGYTCPATMLYPNTNEVYYTIGIIIKKCIGDTVSRQRNYRSPSANQKKLAIWINRSLFIKLTAQTITSRQKHCRCHWISLPLRLQPLVTWIQLLNFKKKWCFITALFSGRPQVVFLWENDKVITVIIQ